MRNEFTHIINKIFNKNRDLGLIHVSTEDDTLDGRIVTVRGKSLVYFGNCSYLGLETDSRIKQASIEAIEKCGSQFSCSRTFLQMGVYEEVEDLLSKIFEKPVLLAPTTSLAHVSNIPILISDGDVILADAQVHNSVRNAIQMVKGDGIKVETIPHNRMDLLETRLQILRLDHERVWYFADGVYSMFGDQANFKFLEYLLNKYEQFHLYVDDAHGMSWTGKHGRGLCLHSMGYHPRLYFTTSLAKGFANCGGVIVFNDEKEKELIKNCGSSFIFSGPLQPAVLGALVESAKIHLSDEITHLQDNLFERMFFFANYAKQKNLPLVDHGYTPLYYIGVGKPEVGFRMSEILREEGLLCNLAQFPAVPLKNAGLRIALTNHHTLADIRKLLDVIAENLPKCLEAEGCSMDEVFEAFGIDGGGERSFEPALM